MKKIDRIIISLLVGSIVLTALSALITHYAVVESRNRVQLVFHTYRVIGKSSELLSALTNAERGQRGFIITDDSSYLKPYLRGIAKLPVLADSLRDLVSDNAQQSKLLHDSILPLVTTKVERMTNALVAYQQSKEHAMQYIRSGRGKVTMDSVHQLFFIFNNREEVLLQNRLAEVAAIHQRQILIRNLSFSAIGIISFLALLTIIRKDRKNNELIKQLNLAHETSEQKVKDRTHELQKQNNLVAELNEELRQNMEEMESFYEALQIRNTKAEDTLREIRDLYDHALCGYHSLDAHGIIVRMNETELNWLGYTLDEVVGKMAVTKILKSEEHQSYYDSFDQFKQQGFIRNKRHTFIRKDGSSFPILLNATAMYDEHGVYKMSRGTIIDITELTLMEQKLRDANHNLIHLNEEKNHFLGIAAHDLKSPLNSMLGLIHLIHAEGETLNSKQREYLNYMEQSCISMQTLINNLLDISRIEQGLHETKLEEVALHELLHRHVEVFREVAKRKDITIIFENAAPGTKITSDPNALQRILDNLMSNAIKFSPNKRNVTIRVTPNHRFVKIEIIDQGQGIKHDEIPKLFTKFQRLSARPTNGEPSTGLGLSIVKELVQILNGNIYVESEVNKGSKFTVELPV